MSVTVEKYKALANFSVPLRSTESVHVVVELRVSPVQTYSVRQSWCSAENGRYVNEYTKHPRT